jgi:hypothetical protein
MHGRHLEMDGKGTIANWTRIRKSILNFWIYYAFNLCGVSILAYAPFFSEKFAIVTQLSSWFRYFDNPNADFVIIGHQTWAPYYFDTIRTFNTSSPCICAVYDQNALPSGCWLLAGLLPLAARLLPQAAGLLSMAGQRLCMASQLYCFFL